MHGKDARTGSDLPDIGIDWDRVPVIDSDRPLTYAEGEVRELTDAELAQFVRAGRPALPASARKRQVTLRLDPDVAEALREAGRGKVSGRANALLRIALGLDPA